MKIKMISIESIRRFIENEKYMYYSHAVTEAKKDGVEPEDIVYIPSREEWTYNFQRRKRR
jgi:hypothetical protein